jgi:CO/xanthine dehydrogenase FAD-binding subunit
MQTISGYHRPDDLEEAIALLNRSDTATLVVAGATRVGAGLDTGDEVVDIQAFADDSITSDGDSISYGSMVRLQHLVDHESTPPLLAETARREGPNTLRNAATIGGTVATADSESELVAGLLAHEARIAIARSEGTIEVPLEELLDDRSLLTGGIITSITVDGSGETASARTGRTPADTSIVAAAGRVVVDGFRIALTGVAAHPVLVDPADVEQLEPPGDFRGSSKYRRELARVLTKRVIELLGGTA